MCEQCIFILLLPLSLYRFSLSFSLQTPGYDHFRDKIATAKTIEGFELVSSDLKSLLLVST